METLKTRKNDPLLKWAFIKIEFLKKTLKKKSLKIDESYFDPLKSKNGQKRPPKRSKKTVFFDPKNWRKNDQKSSKNQQKNKKHKNSQKVITRDTFKKSPKMTFFGAFQKPPKIDEKT